LNHIGFTRFAGFGWSQISFGNNGLNIQTALIVMGVIAVAYTSIGGLKAVIYTDTING
jgi:SSS family solute:Na+ symporter